MGAPLCIGKYNCRRRIFCNAAGYFPEDGRCYVQSGDGHCGLEAGPLLIDSDEDKAEQAEKEYRRGYVSLSEELSGEGVRGAHLHELVGQFVQSVHFDRSDGEWNIVIQFASGHQLQLHRMPECCLMLSHIEDEGADEKD
jgi:hypothetical protein